MRIQSLSIAAVFAVGAIMPCRALAGMPSPVLSDWAAVRFETLSFFVVVLLLCAMVIRWLWNYLAKDFPSMPRLSYGKTLALVVLVGMFLAVVLTMIAGARELLTPGAWQKQGLLYKVASQPTSPAAAAPQSPSQQRLDERKSHLRKLHDALAWYAKIHSGRFPKNDRSSDVDSKLWELRDMAGMRYVYVSGLKTGDPQRVLVYEPDVYDGQRLVVRVDGEIAALSSAELRKLLSETPR
jgi:hypothetical protein